MEVELQTFWTLDGGKWSATWPSHFTPSTHWIQGQVGPQASLHTLDRKPISSTYHKFNINPSAIQSYLIDILMKSNNENANYIGVW